MTTKCSVHTVAVLFIDEEQAKKHPPRPFARIWRTLQWPDGSVVMSKV